MDNSTLSEPNPDEFEKQSDEVIEVIPGDAGEGVPQETEPEITRPSIFSRFFNKETRFGRFMRLFLRWAVVVVVCFGLGVLTAFYVIYKPVKESLRETQAQLALVEKDKDTLTGDLTKAQDDLAALQSQYQQLVDSAKTQSTYITFLELDNQVRGMMYSLAIDDLVTAKVMMANAKKYMDALQPAIVDKDIAALVKDRLNIAASELEMKNVEDALDDMSRLRESMNLVRDALFTE